MTAEEDALVWEAHARRGSRPAFPPPAAFLPPQDPLWAEVVDFLATRLRAEDRVLAPPSLWGALPEGPALSDVFKGSYGWIVVHKGEIGPQDLAFCQRLLRQAVPVLANAVFVVWCARPQADLPDISESPHFEAYCVRLRELAMQNRQPAARFSAWSARLAGLGRVALRHLPRSLHAYSAARTRQSCYHMPLFMLRPPADPALPHLFASPSIARPVSQLCTHEQFQEPDYARLCAILGEAPVHPPHRKQWEFCFILAAIEAAGLLRPGLRAVGFGTGKEPMPAALAAQGLDVVATDAPPELHVASGWARSSQHSSGVLELHRSRLLSREVFLRRVSHRPVDMNAIPADLTGFDIAWSACALEHLGSLRHGLDFIGNSLGCLRPGGLAVHTTEFNLVSDTRTVQHAGLSLYRKCDIEEFLSRMRAAGHDVWPLNLHPGSTPLDEVIDLPPFPLRHTTPHLKLEVRRYVSTSIGLVIRKAGAPEQGQPRPTT